MNAYVAIGMELHIVPNITNTVCHLSLMHDENFWVDYTNQPLVVGGQ